VAPEFQEDLCLFPEETQLLLPLACAFLARGAGHQFWTVHVLICIDTVQASMFPISTSLTAPFSHLNVPKSSPYSVPTDVLGDLVSLLCASLLLYSKNPS
jgi:hypothetical protein